MKRLLLVSLVILAISHAKSQESLSPLQANFQLIQKNENKAAYKTIEDNYLHYIIDTLDLPFWDDFSTEKQKLYFANKNDANVTAIDRNIFRIGSNAPDSIAVSFDTTFSIVYNETSSKFDTTANPPFMVDFYADPDDSTAITHTQQFWPAYTAIDSVGNKDTLLLVDTVYRNPVSFFYVQDDASLWMDKKPYAFVNNSFGVNPITVGVASFDGLNFDGEPYDFSLLSYGAADTLTSKPINLDYQISDSVYLSFYYQIKGWGDLPEEDEGDSLMLQFYSPVNKEWKRVWGITGQGDDEVVTDRFIWVDQLIDSSAYLAKGFKFRFINYGRLFAASDHFHIDYVYINNDRTRNDSIIKDYAFVTPPQSFLKDYTAMPWEHYKWDTIENVVENVDYELRNLHDVPALIRTFYRAHGPTSIDTADAANSLIQNFPYGVTVQNRDIATTKGDFYFPPDDNDRATFEIKHYLETGSQLFSKINDTVTIEQKFESFYAYDDGTAEVAYSLPAAGGKVAYQFHVDQADTLRGVHFYFPKYKNDVSSRDFLLTVWSSLSPEVKVFQTLRRPIYSTGRNGFTRYDFEEPVVVDGTYYIGWQQITNDDIYIGYDFNLDNSAKISYNSTGSWRSSRFNGSLMLRPDFGDYVHVVSSEEFIEQEANITVYPNPTNNRLFFNSDEIIVSVEVYGLSGQLILMDQGNINYIETGNLENGIYFLKIATQSGTISQQKVIVQH